MTIFVLNEDNIMIVKNYILSTRQCTSSFDSFSAKLALDNIKSSDQRSPILHQHLRLKSFKLLHMGHC